MLGLLEHLQGVALAGDGFFFVPFSTKATRFELPLDDSPFVLDGAGRRPAVVMIQYGQLLFICPACLSARRLSIKL